MTYVQSKHFTPTVRRAELARDARGDRVPEDMEEIVKEHPKEMPELMRAARGLLQEQFEKLQQAIKRMRSKVK